ncbi:MAG: alpha/beta hydrolase family protein, partial [Acidimicrobiia bacterium]
VRGRWPSRRWLPAVLGLVPVLSLAAWLLWPGPGAVASLRPERLAPIGSVIPDPGTAGSHAVVEFTYGSGNSRRSEFGAETDVVTQPVDGSGIWDGFGGGVGWWWERYWGFGLEALPLNGLVWYPEGDGPFPLVLIVHGNHAASRSSDPGYEYLGRHLASRGFIAVSIDENFLNGTLLGDPAGAEMPLRGWMLLEHVAQWQRWNSDPSFPLYGQVDTQAVGLIGHSRGGEAAVAATSMLNGSCGPGNDRIDPNLAGADIDAVVAIAPSDGLYRPCGSQARLLGTSYLTINGGMDGDVGTFYGLAQYGRTRVEDGEFKASAYLHRANHGQFNQGWGFGDLGIYDWLVLDRASLLTDDEQQQAARAIVGAFLEATLHDRSEYREMFRRPDAFAMSLPDDVLVTRYEDAELETIEGQRPNLVSETLLHEAESKKSVLMLRVGDRSQEDSALSISWRPGSQPAITYRLETPYALPSTGIVSIDLGASSDDYVPAGISITLHSGQSASATVSLDLMTAFRPPLGTELLKWPGMAELTGRYDWDFESERVLQTYELPASAFLAVSPDLDLSNVTALDVTFDGRVAGTVLIDEFGFRN